MELKKLIIPFRKLKDGERWDIDFHLPPVGIRLFPKEMLVQVCESADTIKKKKDPTKNPEVTFQYVDISSINVETGSIVNPQELTGEEAPSRARKVISAYDIIVSTCRPTRGAIAVVPEELHGQICSTGFSVVRAKDDVNPFYLHFALRLPSTLEQFRKWSTGSSYPAILDEDIAKTLIPLPPPNIQDQISRAVKLATLRRQRIINRANQKWKKVIEGIFGVLSKDERIPDVWMDENIVHSISQVKERLVAFPPIT